MCPCYTSVYTGKDSLYDLSDQHPIIIYDGMCVLCNGWIRWVLRHDKAGHLRLISMQDPAAQLVLANDDLIATDSVVLLYHQKPYIRSEAALKVFTLLGGKWPRLVYLLGMVPLAWRDTAYKGIARNRYRWWGKYDTCPLPPPEWRDRFLDH